jgi:hypothetical protein
MSDWTHKERTIRTSDFAADYAATVTERGPSMDQ